VWVLELDVSNLRVVCEDVYVGAWFLNYIWGMIFLSQGFNSPI